MMFPSDGKYVCKRKFKENGEEKICGYTQEIAGATIVKTNSQEKEIGILSEDATLPKTNILCPKCGHTEAYYVIRQTRAADEPETVFYRCCKCNHNWRVN